MIFAKLIIGTLISFKWLLNNNQTSNKYSLGCQLYVLIPFHVSRYEYSTQTWVLDKIYNSEEGICFTDNSRWTKIVYPKKKQVTFSAIQCFGRPIFFTVQCIFYFLFHFLCKTRTLQQLTDRPRPDRWKHIISGNNSRRRQNFYDRNITVENTVENCTVFN